MRLRADRHLFVRIEDDDVGVGSDGDRSLAREEPEDSRGRCRGDLDKTVHADAAARDTAVVDEAHAVLDARSAVRDLREIVDAELFLILEAERTVIGRDDLEIIHLQAAPEFVLVPLLAKRRSHDVFRAFKAWLLV